MVKNPTLPAPGGERDNNADFAYSQAYLVHLNSSLVERAKQYGMRMATERSVGFYYLPKGEADTTKAKYLISFRFKAKNDWKETMLTGIGSTGNDTSGVERDFVKVLDDMIYHAAH